MRASAIVTSEVRGGVWILDIDDDLGSGKNDKYNISLDRTLKGLGQGLCVIDTPRPKKERMHEIYQRDDMQKKQTFVKMNNRTELQNTSFSLSLTSLPSVKEFMLGSDSGPQLIPDMVPILISDLDSGPSRSSDLDSDPLLISGLESDPRLESDLESDPLIVSDLGWGHNSEQDSWEVSKLGQDAAPSVNTGTGLESMTRISNSVQRSLPSMKINLNLHKASLLTSW